MTATSREQIFTALFDLLGTVVFPTPILENTTWAGKARKWVQPSQVANEAQPFLAQFEGPLEQYERKGNRLPAIRDLHVKLFCWARVNSTDPGETGSTYLNSIMEGVEGALNPDTSGYGSPGLQTLGGLVQWCRIDGNVLRYTGDADNQAMICIPVKILWP